MPKGRSTIGDGNSRPGVRDLTGCRIGKYEIIRTLGRGGMGEVLLAEDQILNRQVAIKILLSKYVTNARLLKRFAREARAASALNHPHIVSIYEFGEGDVGKYIVMEYVQGSTLRQACEPPTRAERIVEWAVEIARALGAAHAAGIVHRDIKPENILVRQDGYVKVLDFGLARQVRSGGPDSTTAKDLDGETETQEGQLLGTIKYMSPEQSLGRTVTSATDIFSLGIVLYEMLTGTHPFAAQTPASTLHAITSEEPIRPTKLAPGLQHWLESLILRMLRKDPAARPTANEVIAELRAASDHEPELRASSRFVRAFVGRQTERAALKSALKATDRDGGRVLCLSGEPGIGKTTLVEEFLFDLEQSGNRHLVARGRCSERLAESEAYFPFLEALDALFRHDADGFVGRTLKLLAPTWYQHVSGRSSGGPGEHAVSQERMKREMSAFLEEISTHRLLVLFIDDLHWADDSTIDMLAYLAGHFHSIRMLIVVTYRPTEMLISHHPFLTLKLDLMGRNLCRELEIEYLTIDDVDRYIGLAFPGNAFPEQFPRLVHARTEGNPLFMTDLLHYLRDRGMISEGERGWTVTQGLGEIERNLPDSVRSIVQRKIDQLQDIDRKLLVVASIQGFKFDSACVSRVLGADPANVEEQLERLERIYTFVRFVEEKEFPDGTPALNYQFVHVLYQNALYASLRPTRKVQLSLTMAETLLGLYGDRSHDIASNLAFLFETGREFARAAEYSILAARNALQVLACKEAAALSRRALELLATLPPSVVRINREIEAHMTLGVSLVTLKGGYSGSEVEASYGRALELCEGIGDNVSMFPAFYGLWSVHALRAEYKQALELGERMLPIAKKSEDPMLLVMTFNALGYTKPFVGDFAGARNDLEEMMRRHTREIQETSFARFGAEPKLGGLPALAWSYWALGYPDKASQLMRQAREMTQEVKHPVTVAGVKAWSAALALDLEDFDEAKRLAEDALAYTKNHGLVEGLGHSHLCYGAALAALGEFENGIEEIRNAIKLHDGVGCALARSSMLLCIAEALGASGDMTQAQDVLAQARAFTKRTNELYRAPEFDRIEGNLLLWSFKRDEAKLSSAEKEAILAASETCFRSSLEIARAHQARSFELKTAIDFARLQQAQHKTTDARTILESNLNWFTEGFNTPLLARAQRTLSSL